MDDKDWISIKNNPVISDDIKAIHCDTRDFHVLLNTEQPKVKKGAMYNYDKWCNQGLSKFYKIIKKTDRSDFSITKDEIIPWLTELCEKSGEFEKDWRLLISDVDYCRNWEIKYIRFVRNVQCPDEFIVCNSYFMPVKYKDIIPNLKKD